MTCVQMKNKYSARAYFLNMMAKIVHIYMVWSSATDEAYVDTAYLDSDSVDGASVNGAYVFVAKTFFSNFVPAKTKIAETISDVPFSISAIQKNTSVLQIFS